MATKVDRKYSLRPSIHYLTSAWFSPMVWASSFARPRSDRLIQFAVSIVICSGSPMIDLVLNEGIELCHPSRKNKDAARAEYPYLLQPSELGPFAR